MRLQSTWVEKSAKAAALWIIVLIWALHLVYPMQRLQDARWLIFGNSVPIYFFFIVPPVLIAGILTVLFKRQWSKWELLWLALPLICLPGVFVSTDRLWSLRQWSSFMIRGPIPGGVLFFAARARSRSFIVAWIYPAILAAALIGLVEVLFHFNPIWKDFSNVIQETGQITNPFYRPGYQMAPPTPPRGTQGNRIPYAATLVGFFPLGIWVLKHKKWPPTTAYAAVCLLSSILILAGSRSAWMGLGVSLVLMASTGLIKSRFEWLSIAGSVLFLLGAACALPGPRHALWSRLHSFHFAENGIRTRLYGWETARMLKDCWAWWVGYGQYPSAADRYYRGPRWLPYFHGQTWIGTPDSQYLRWAIENGILSLTLLAAFFAGLIRESWARIQSIADAEAVDFYKALLAGWAAVATTFMFFDGYYWGACNMTFWALLGLFATSLDGAELW